MKLYDYTIGELVNLHNNCKCKCENCIAYSGNKQDKCLIEQFRLYFMPNNDEPQEENEE